MTQSDPSWEEAVEGEDDDSVLTAIAPSRRRVLSTAGVILGAGGAAGIGGMLTGDSVIQVTSAQAGDNSFRDDGFTSTSPGLVSTDDGSLDDVTIDPDLNVFFDGFDSSPSQLRVSVYTDNDASGPTSISPGDFGFNSSPGNFVRLGGDLSFTADGQGDGAGPHSADGDFDSTSGQLTVDFQPTSIADGTDRGYNVDSFNSETVGPPETTTVVVVVFVEVTESAGNSFSQVVAEDFDVRVTNEKAKLGDTEDDTGDEDGDGVQDENDAADGVSGQVNPNVEGGDDDDDE